MTEVGEVIEFVTREDRKFLDRVANEGGGLVGVKEGKVLYISELEEGSFYVIDQQDERMYHIDADCVVNRE
jgi:hypothetical protein